MRLGAALYFAFICARASASCTRTVAEYCLPAMMEGYSCKVFAVNIAQYTVYCAKMRLTPYVCVLFRSAPCNSVRLKEKVVRWNS